MHKQLSFNAFVFLGLGFQYALMHLFAWGDTIAITEMELVCYIVYSAAGLTGFIYKSRRTVAESVSAMVPLFYSVLWTVALCSHFYKESYPATFTLMISMGLFSALLALVLEIRVIAKA